MLLIGGALLLTPGFVTDAIGFTCLLPGLRRPIARWIINRGVLHALNVTRINVGEVNVQRGRQSGRSRTTIEGEFENESNSRDDDDHPPHRKPD